MALDNVAAAFVACGRRSPIISSLGKVHTHINHQTRSYKQEDRATSHEKALSPIVFRRMLDTAQLPRELARVWLVCAALFFAMRSCEYTFTGNVEQKTRPIRPCDIVFWIGARIIPHDSPLPHTASLVSVDFGEQKSKIKNETVSQDSNDEKDLNPAPLLARTIKRLQSYPGYSNTWDISTFYDGKSFSKISSKEVLIDLRATVDCIGANVIGFSSSEISTHSVRASLVMMMYQAKDPVYTIMLIGRWSSDAFLSYIKKQVREFTKGVSSRMLQ